MKRLFLFSILLHTSLGLALAQSNPHKCATMDHRAARLQANPVLADHIAQSELATQAWIAANPRVNGGPATIPVVVHVIYSNANENVSTAQVQSQIDVLNEDFARLNADAPTQSHPFFSNSANTQIQFCLATRDPNGNTTTGITRTSTNVASFNGNGDEKYTASGGKDNWDPTKYLNLWVCDLGASGGTLGYAAFPDELASFPGDDGVVIHFEAFGTIGTAGQGGFGVNNLGRTATHEVGHWLNLFHIWGDNTPNCGDDLVADTPEADEENYGCPSFPHAAFNQCGTDGDGVMYMNYMDYVDDNCMNMFTSGQSIRMNAAINGDRSALFSSNGCSQTVAVDGPDALANLRLAPNPGTGVFTLEGLQPSARACNATVSNSHGVVVHQSVISHANSARLDLSHLPAGIYHVHLQNQRDDASFKAVILR